MLLLLAGAGTDCVGAFDREDPAATAAAPELDMVALDVVGSVDNVGEKEEVASELLDVGAPAAGEASALSTTIVHSSSSTTVIVACSSVRCFLRSGPSAAVSDSRTSLDDEDDRGAEDDRCTDSVSSILWYTMPAESPVDALPSLGPPPAAAATAAGATAARVEVSGALTPLLLILVLLLEQFVEPLLLLPVALAAALLLGAAEAAAAAAAGGPFDTELAGALLKLPKPRDLALSVLRGMLGSVAALGLRGIEGIVERKGADDVPVVVLEPCSTGFGAPKDSVVCFLPSDLSFFASSLDDDEPDFLSVATAALGCFSVRGTAAAAAVAAVADEALAAPACCLSAVAEEWLEGAATDDDAAAVEVPARCCCCASSSFFFFSAASSTSRAARASSFCCFRLRASSSAASRAEIAATALVMMNDRTAVLCGVESSGSVVVNCTRRA